MVVVVFTWILDPGAPLAIPGAAAVLHGTGGRELLVNDQHH
jgi:hypothetical protein